MMLFFPSAYYDRSIVDSRCLLFAAEKIPKNRRSQHRYQIVAAEAMEGMAKRLEELHPDRFRFHKTSWGKFPDGTDNIEVGGRVVACGRGCVCLNACFSPTRWRLGLGGCVGAAKKSGCCCPVSRFLFSRVRPS